MNGKTESLKLQLVSTLNKYLSNT